VQDVRNGSLLGFLALSGAADVIVISSRRELGNMWVLFQIRVKLNIQLLFEIQ